jgi:hypothetical protein
MVKAKRRQKCYSGNTLRNFETKYETNLFLSRKFTEQTKCVTHSNEITAKYVGQVNRCQIYRHNHF